jgi:hypothetical protein
MTLGAIRTRCGLAEARVQGWAVQKTAEKICGV